MAPVKITVSLTVETSQPEIQELRLTADYTREVQSIVVKAFADDNSSSSLTSGVAEIQRITVEVGLSEWGRGGSVAVGRGYPRLGWPYVFVDNS